MFSPWKRNQPQIFSWASYLKTHWRLDAVGKPLYLVAIPSQAPFVAFGSTPPLHCSILSMWCVYRTMRPNPTQAISSPHTATTFARYGCWSGLFTCIRLSSAVYWKLPQESTVGRLRVSWKAVLSMNNIDWGDQRKSFGNWDNAANFLLLCRIQLTSEHSCCCGGLRPEAPQWV